MLRNVLVDYLNSIRREREFDAPFLALLSTMSFTDIHLTHGTAEKGKDFIAKQSGEQWVFQTKKGDIGVGDLNSGIMGQLQAAAMTSYNHPAFDKDLPRRIVLVTTGLETQQVGDQIQAFSVDALQKLQHPPAEIWNRNKLVELLLEHGLEGIRATKLSALNLDSQGRFFMIYGSIVQRSPKLAEIEEYSLNWLNSELPASERMLRGSLESTILASKCRENNLLYESFYCNLAALRMSMVELFNDYDTSRKPELLALCESQMTAVQASAKEYTDGVWTLWSSSEKRLDRLIQSASMFVTYPMHCCRIIETLGLIALGGDAEEAQAASKRLVDFIQSEPGTHHPISDRYAISIVVAALALEKQGHREIAKSLVKLTTIWLCDRNEFGAGLAHIDATVEDEVNQFLGYPFSGLGISNERSSLLASALVDLSAYFEDSELYADIVNDLIAVDIVPEYFQASDSSAQFLIDHDEVIQYPGIEFKEKLDSNYSPYGATEPPTYALFDSLGICSYMALCLLVRDRYLPSLWSK